MKLLAVLAVLSVATIAQELDPRSYLPSPPGMNILVAGIGASTGDITFDPSFPSDNSTATLYSPRLGYYRGLNLLGRSASLTISAPYIAGHLQGLYLGEYQQIYRSGLGDPRMRLSVNLYGAPSMDLKKLAGWKQRTLIGLSLSMAAPLSQYDANKLINIGTNRWSFKPELGVSHRRGRWMFDAYAGLWVFTDNKQFQGRKRTQEPIISTEYHVSYNLRTALWASLDANFYSGGRTAVNGRPFDDAQRNSRIGATIALPISRRQVFKLAVSKGAYTTIGGDFWSVGMSYSFAFGGGF